MGNDSLQRSERKPVPGIPTTRAEALFDKLRRRSVTRKSMWGAHLAGYVSINLFLAFIDFITGGRSPWFLYVAGAWAIPLLGHYVHYKRRERLKKKLELM